MFLADIEKRLSRLQNTPTLGSKLVAVVNRRCNAPAKVEGKTIGVVIPPELRERLMVLKDRLQLSSYKQVVLVCIEVGVTVLEEKRTSSPLSSVPNKPKAAPG